MRALMHTCLRLGDSMQLPKDDILSSLDDPLIQIKIRDRVLFKKNLDNKYSISI